MSLLVGLASEHLVISDLAKAGIVSFPTPHLLPYDLVADISGRLYRIQVKATTGLTSPRDGRLPAYRFRIHRGQGHSHRYKPDDFDLCAFVSFASGEIAYAFKSELSGTSATFIPSERSKPASNPSAKYLSDLPLTRILTKLKGAA